MPDLSQSEKFEMMFAEMALLRQQLNDQQLELTEQKLLANEQQQKIARQKLLANEQQYQITEQQKTTARLEAQTLLLFIYSTKADHSPPAD